KDRQHIWQGQPQGGRHGIELNIGPGRLQGPGLMMDICPVDAAEGARRIQAVALSQPAIKGTKGGDGPGWLVLRVELRAGSGWPPLAEKTSFAVAGLHLHSGVIVPQFEPGAGSHN